MAGRIKQNAQHIKNAQHIIIGKGMAVMEESGVGTTRLFFYARGYIRKGVVAFHKVVPRGVFTRHKGLQKRYMKGLTQRKT